MQIQQGEKLIITSNHYNEIVVPRVSSKNNIMEFVENLEERNKVEGKLISLVNCENFRRCKVGG